MRFNFFDFPNPEVGWSGTGNALNNVITGLYAMVDRLDGRGGDDIFYGGSGEVMKRERQDLRRRERRRPRRRRRRQ